MISCTEFIPCYSELFTYLENKQGRGEVDNFWKYLFVPDGKGIPLINFVLKDGIRGCYNYWAGSLNEEAADLTMYLNEKRGFFRIVMHKCPSKGRLLKLEEEIGITPYHDYCLHCDSYRAAIEKVGLKYLDDFNGIEKAACALLIALLFLTKYSFKKMKSANDIEIAEHNAGKPVKADEDDDERLT